ncbi:MAG: PqqD family protein [Ruminococcaceae bacterium]|nr:PqqD family protein [Oscillospiraceae bacterium]
MKLKEEFVLRQVADVWVVLPVGKTSVDFNGMLTLNESGALLWNTLEQGGDREKLADALLAEYEVARDTALADVDEFIAKLKEIGCLE